MGQSNRTQDHPTTITTSFLKNGAKRITISKIKTKVPRPGTKKTHLRITGTNLTGNQNLKVITTKRDGEVSYF
jgi:hypothetical protein